MSVYEMIPNFERTASETGSANITIRSLTSSMQSVTFHCLFEFQLEFRVMGENVTAQLLARRKLISAYNTKVAVIVISSGDFATKKSPDLQSKVQ